MSERVLGGVGSYVIFENDVVKVWQNDLQPGESSDWHLHTNNYLYVATSKGDLKIEHDSGDIHKTVMEVGKVVMGEKDSVHQLSNIGTNDYSSVIIEIKT